MSGVREIADRARKAALDAVWRQWAVLGAPVSGSGPIPRSVVDPEALLLLSCVLRGRERRLDDVLGWWAKAGSTFLSVQRVRTLGRLYPASEGAGISAFADAALQGGDGRWRPLSAPALPGDALVSRGKRAREPRLASCPALMLRLRAAFGVGLKADVLAVLIAGDGRDASTKALVHATGYTAAAIRRAAREMEAARVVRATAHRPVTYRVDAAAWNTFFGLDAEIDGGWRYFAEVFAFLADVLGWAEGAEGEDGYLAASTARDVFERHRLAFDLNRLEVPDPSDAPGAAFLDAFAVTVDAVADWLATNL